MLVAVTAGQLISRCVQHLQEAPAQRSDEVHKGSCSPGDEHQQKGAAVHDRHRRLSGCESERVTSCRWEGLTAGKDNGPKRELGGKKSLKN